MIKLQVIGNIGQNARVTDVNGNKSINFSVAFNKSYTDKDGVVTESTTWVNCTYWRKSGQSVEVAKYLTAGGKVFVEGTPQIETYVNKEGKTVASLNLIVHQIELLGSAGKRDEEPEYEPAAPAKKRL